MQRVLGPSRLRRIKTQQKNRTRAVMRGFSSFLFHNLIFIDTGDECDAGFFEVNLTGAVDVTDGEDLAVELSCQSIPPASSI